MKKNNISGTKEWSTHSVNIFKGCCHNCRYCYARNMAVVRFKSKTEVTWKIEELNEKELLKKRTKKKGRIMFPTSHDITHGTVDACITVLKKMLCVGNTILIVSKPNFNCITRLCVAITEYKNQVMFRFTIGTMDNKILKFWEPGAPCFEERLESLKYSFNTGFQTSLSVEPFLNNDIIELYNKTFSYITDSYWIGKMNRVSVKNWQPEEIKIYTQLKELQSNKNIIKLYNSMKYLPKVKFKESIKKIVGIPLATKADLDI